MAEGDNVSKILGRYGAYQKRASEARAQSKSERDKEVAQFKEISDKVIAPTLGAIKVEIETEGYAAATRLDQDPPAIELQVDLLSKPGAPLVVADTTFLTSNFPWGKDRTWPCIARR